MRKVLITFLKKQAQYSNGIFLTSMFKASKPKVMQNWIYQNKHLYSKITTSKGPIYCLNRAFYGLYDLDIPSSFTDAPSKSFILSNVLFSFFMIDHKKNWNFTFDEISVEKRKYIIDSFNNLGALKDKTCLITCIERIPFSVKNGYFYYIPKLALSGNSKNITSELLKEVDGDFKKESRKVLPKKAVNPFGLRFPLSKSYDILHRSKQVYPSVDGAVSGNEKKYLDEYYKDIGRYPKGYKVGVYIINDDK